MKTFSYQDIESWGPCYSPDRYLAKDWSGTVLNILDDKRIPFEDRLWVIARTDLVSEKLLRLFAVWCARRVQRLMKDERSLKALDVAEAFANGNATKDELAAAEDAAWAAARAAARAAAGSAAWAAAEDAALAAAGSAAGSAAEDAALAAAGSAAGSAARAAARAAAEDAQERKLREMILAGIDSGDVYF